MRTTNKSSVPHRANTYKWNQHPPNPRIDHCVCGHPYNSHVQRFCSVKNCRCLYFQDARTKGAKPAQESPQTQKPTNIPCEVVIERHGGLWYIHEGDQYSPTRFMDYADPMTVSLALKAQAAGPINVIWNLT
jgi:hypothetical protein